MNCLQCITQLLSVTDALIVLSCCMFIWCVRISACFTLFKF